MGDSFQSPAEFNQVGCDFGGRSAGCSRTASFPDYCRPGTNVKFFNGVNFKFDQALRQFDVKP